MVITEADIQQFFDLLRENAELRERARDIILADDFRALPKEMAKLSSEVAAFTAETRARFGEVDKRFDQVDQRFDGVDKRLDKLSGDVGNLLGSDFERAYRSNLSAHLGRRFRRIRPVVLGEEGVFEEAIETGRLSADEWEDAVRLDLVVKATPRAPQDADEVMLAIELSQTVNVSDVERAHRRGELLRKLWPNVQACVDGEQIESDAKARAEAIGVETFVTREVSPSAA